MGDFNQRAEVMLTVPGISRKKHTRSIKLCSIRVVDEIKLTHKFDPLWWGDWFCWDFLGFCWFYFVLRRTRGKRLSTVTTYWKIMRGSLCECIRYLEFENGVFSKCCFLMSYHVKKAKGEKVSWGKGSNLWELWHGRNQRAPWGRMRGRGWPPAPRQTASWTSTTSNWRDRTPPPLEQKSGENRIKNATQYIGCIVSPREKKNIATAPIAMVLPFLSTR